MHSSGTAEEKLKMVLDLCDSMGIRYLERDGTRISSWALISSSGCFTGTHQDAGGLCTFVHCHTGAKFWCYVDPKDSPAEITAAMKYILTVLQDAEDTETICNHADLNSIFVTPGSTV